MSNLLPAQRTPFVRNEDIKSEWLLVDAKGMNLGRLATRLAYMLRGKHKPAVSFHQEIGDHIVVINAQDIQVSGRGKMDQKVYYSHTLYPGGLRKATLREKMEGDPTFALQAAVKRMLPKGPLGRKLINNLRVFAGEEHTHSAQKPRPIEIKFK